MSDEQAVMAKTRLEASKKGVTLWRNNSGAVHTEDGRFIRFGLGNESFAINKVFKSSDLVGIRPVVITEDMVGKTIGQFVAREVKRTGWKYRGGDREAAQKSFLDFIDAKGGDAAFTTGEGSL